ncbi:MAG: DUF3575 domain-containing protein [Alistipes sp.]|nr:DUF3575 domain-containing protein [Alistipes sp.]
MHSIAKKLIIAVAVLAIPAMAKSQVYTKLNLLYACAGIVNPQLEFVVGPHSSIVIDPTYSPWESIDGKHFHFGILQNEYRCYIKREAQGFYFSTHIGVQLFDITRPYPFSNGKLVSWRGGFCRGFGAMFGLGIGYEHRFKERWVVDAYFAFDRMWSWYNGYDDDGKIQMYPRHQKEPPYPDPFNGSAEWLPSKIGLSIGYMIFDPQSSRRKAEKAQNK